MGKKVMAAMSGGVDSSVAALLLKQQGYDICGVTLSLCSNGDIPPAGDDGRCLPPDGVGDARRVCRLLNAEHYLFSMEDRFRREVIEPFAEGYRRGETPNPCIECNRSIKFSGILEKAELLGYDFIATGHYAISEYDGAAQRWVLRRAADPQKDQSYVLYVLTQRQLSKTLFPLGRLSKPQIRAIAGAHGLAAAGKKESQDICFVPDGDYGRFLSEKLGIPSPPGRFVGVDGGTLGRHNGIIRYTIGQRRGLGVSAGRRLFVLGKDIARNEITLGDERLLFGSRMTLRGENWVSIAPPSSPIRAQVKSRYRQSAQPAWLHPTENGVVVEFDSPQRALTAGQAAVFYDGDVVLGGGTISFAQPGVLTEGTL